jgi:hypothetical protein
MVSATRSITVASRISLEERALIDEQADALGAVARAEEKESGRAGDIWPQVTELRAQLAQTRSWIGKWSREVQRLRGTSAIGPMTVAAAKDVLAGDAAAQVKLATIWSHAMHRQRVDLLPIVAALVSSEFEQVAGGSPITNHTTDTGIAFLERVLWSIETLDCDAGKGEVFAPLTACGNGISRCNPNLVATTGRTRMPSSVPRRARRDPAVAWEPRRNAAQTARQRSANGMQTDQGHGFGEPDTRHHDGRTT